MPRLNDSIDFCFTDVTHAHLYRLENMDDFPSTQNVEILEMQRDGNRLRVARIIDILLDQPDFLRKALPKATHEFVEELTFDADAGREEFAVFARDHRDKFCIDGYIQYEPDGDTTQREVDFKVAIRYLMLGSLTGIVESAYAKGMQREVDDLCVLIKRGLPS